jgi:hypothetical protein
MASSQALYTPPGPNTVPEKARQNAEKEWKICQRKCQIKCQNVCEIEYQKKIVA